LPELPESGYQTLSSDSPEELSDRCPGELGRPASPSNASKVSKSIVGLSPP